MRRSIHKHHLPESIRTKHKINTKKAQNKNDTSEKRKFLFRILFLLVWCARLLFCYQIYMINKNTYVVRTSHKRTRPLLASTHCTCEEKEEKCDIVVYSRGGERARGIQIEYPRFDIRPFIFGR